MYVYIYIHISPLFPIIRTGQKHPHEKRLLSPWFHGPSGSSRLFAFAGLQISWGNLSPLGDVQMRHRYQVIGVFLSHIKKRETSHRNGCSKGIWYEVARRFNKPHIFKKKGKEAIEMDVAARKLRGNLQIDMATKNPHISWWITFPARLDWLMMT